MYRRLGSWCFRRRKTVVALWLLVLVVGGSATGLIGPHFATNMELPNVESRQGLDILEREMGGAGAGIEGTIVFRSETGFEDPAVRQPLVDYLAEVDAENNVTVVSPFAAQKFDASSPLAVWYLSGVSDPALLLKLADANSSIATAGSESGKIAFAKVEINRDSTMDAARKQGTQIESIAPKVPGVQIEYGGRIFEHFEAPDSELLGLAFAIVILILAFGSVLAMGLPIGVALAGIGVGGITLALLSNLIAMPDFATTLGVMIGLGVGIDYALFIVTRYREELHRGHSVEESVVMAIDTSGRAVTFAGLTVVISLLGMLVMGVSFVSGLGIGAATVVTVTMIASITLLPALLGFAGERVEVTRWRGLIAAGFVAVGLVGLGLNLNPLLVGFPLAIIVMIAGFAFAPLKKEFVRKAPKPLHETSAYRWSRFVQGHPWPLAIGSVAILVILTVPLFGIRLGFSDAGNLPENNTGRKAYDLVSDGFGAGSNGKLLLVAEVPAGVDISNPKPLIQVSKQLEGVQGVQTVSPPVPSNLENPSESGAVLWVVTPTTSPQDEATTNLVNDLRENLLPQVAEQTGLDVLVTGQVGISVDFTDYLSGRLFLFFAAVLSLSFLLLMIVFRSLLVPLKAVIMNLLSIGAAYGIIVAIFQWGWAKDLFGIEPAPIEPFIPMMLFAIVFGLSMDYEVFLLSRVREEWLHTGDSHTSVANGLAATARVITAAAAIMVFVFGSFLLEADRTIKLFGFGLAIAVLLDASLVRMLLVPASMELMGDKNWWFPAWLDRLLPSINVEGPTEIVEDEAEPQKQEALV
ncbi:MAG: MMPL family transporter [Actinomycetes bacterium]